jgi:predicted Na+-dependent transporter
MQLAAGYQVWGGLLTPIVRPRVVWVAGLLRGLTIWIPPRVVLLQIAENQFVPATAGLALPRFLPEFSTQVVVWFNRIGNGVLTVESLRCCGSCARR